MVIIVRLVVKAIALLLDNDLQNLLIIKYSVCEITIYRMIVTWYLFFIISLMFLA